MTHKFKKGDWHLDIDSSSTLCFVRCRCYQCRTRDKAGLIWERHPDGVWRKRNTTQRITNE
jgi:hypothetical protein